MVVICLVGFYWPMVNSTFSVQVNTFFISLEFKHYYRLYSRDATEATLKAVPQTVPVFQGSSQT